MPAPPDQLEEVADRSGTGEWREVSAHTWNWWDGHRITCQATWVDGDWKYRNLAAAARQRRHARWPIVAVLAVLGLAGCIGLGWVGASYNAAVDDSFLDNLPTDAPMPASVLNSAKQVLSAAGITCKEPIYSSGSGATCVLGSDFADILTVEQGVPESMTCNALSADGAWYLQFGLFGEPSDLSYRSPRSVSSREALLRRIAAANPSLQVNYSCTAR